MAEFTKEQLDDRFGDVGVVTFKGNGVKLPSGDVIKEFLFREPEVNDNKRMEKDKSYDPKHTNTVLSLMLSLCAYIPTTNDDTKFRNIRSDEINRIKLSQLNHIAPQMNKIMGIEDEDKENFSD